VESEKRVRLGLSGLGSFALVIANALRKCRSAELVTCFDIIAENRKSSAVASAPQRGRKPVAKAVSQRCAS